MFLCINSEIYVYDQHNITYGSLCVFVCVCTQSYMQGLVELKIDVFANFISYCTQTGQIHKPQKILNTLK